MAFIKQTFTGIICDNCKEQFRETEDDAFFFEEDDANEAVTDEEWLVETKGHFCPNCYSHPSPNTIFIDKERYKSE